MLMTNLVQSNVQSLPTIINNEGTHFQYFPVIPEVSTLELPDNPLGNN